MYSIAPCGKKHVSELVTRTRQCGKQYDDQSNKTIWPCGCEEYINFYGGKLDLCTKVDNGIRQ